MATIIGTDEAGYGPNYGPLVVAATRWEISDGNVDLRDALRSAVCQTKSETSDSRIEVADSKTLFGARKSLSKLERGVLVFAQQLLEPTSKFSKFLEQINEVDALSSSEQKLFNPVNDDDDSCPIEISHEQLHEDSKLLNSRLAESGVRFTGLKIRCVFPEQFNALLISHGNKATMLSHATLGLVNLLLPESGDTIIQCDKHGGRSKYAGLIQHCLTTNPVKVGTESLYESSYSWQQGDGKCTAQFVAKGESNLAIALASMTAKYVRERYMNCWNRFWLSHIPKLKPTAGYPVDARRFRSAIASKQSELGIDEHQVWRAK